MDPVTHDTVDFPRDPHPRVQDLGPNCDCEDPKALFSLFRGTSGTVVTSILGATENSRWFNQQLSSQNSIGNGLVATGPKRHPDFIPLHRGPLVILHWGSDLQKLGSPNACI